MDLREWKEEESYRTSIRQKGKAAAPQMALGLSPEVHRPLLTATLSRCHVLLTRRKDFMDEETEASVFT